MTTKDGVLFGTIQIKIALGIDLSEKGEWKQSKH